MSKRDGKSIDKTFTIVGQGTAGKAMFINGLLEPKITTKKEAHDSFYQIERSAGEHGWFSYEDVQNVKRYIEKLENDNIVWSNVPEDVKEAIDVIDKTAFVYEVTLYRDNEINFNEDGLVKTRGYIPLDQKYIDSIRSYFSTVQELESKLHNYETVIKETLDGLNDDIDLDSDYVKVRYAKQKLNQLLKSVEQGIRGEVK